MSIILIVNFTHHLNLVTTFTTSIFLKWLKLLLSFFCCSKLRPEDLIQYTITDKKDKRAPKAHVNAVFFRQLRELLRKYRPFFVAATPVMFFLDQMCSICEKKKTRLTKSINEWNAKKGNNTQRHSPRSVSKTNNKNKSHFNHRVFVSDLRDIYIWLYVTIVGASIK